MRIPSLLLVVVLLGVAGCGEKDVPKPVTESVPIPVDSISEVEHAEWGALFNEAKADSGCVVIVEAPTGKVHVFNKTRAEKRYLPASTFKIFNSLVALETGVADSSTFLLRWDGVNRQNPDWNHDQTMAEAFRNSTVWYYRELARRVGREPYLTAMKREHYGNAMIGDSADMFWLDNTLQISAREQVDFLQRLQAGKLGFSERSQRIVRDIMVRRDTLGATMRWKTGWGLGKEFNIGWLVGWLERGDRRWFFAMNLQASSEDYPMMKVRLHILLGALRSLGALPEGWPEE